MPGALPELSPPSLRALQKRFLHDLALRDGPAGEPYAALFEDPPHGGFENRRAVYRSGYVARIAEALEDDYRAVRRILGAGPFAALARRYVDAAPPESFDLARVSDRLPAFLADDRLSQQLPFLYDLARLELAQARAFVAPDASPLAWEELACGGAEAAADTVIRLCPGTVVIRSDWPLDDIQASRDLPDDEISIPLEGRPVTLLIWRRTFDVRTRGIDRDEMRLIATFEQGATLASLPAILQCGDDTTLLNRFLELFRRLVGEGIFLNSGTPHNATVSQRKESQ